MQLIADLVKALSKPGQGIGVAHRVALAAAVDFSNRLRRKPGLDLGLGGAQGADVSGNRVVGLGRIADTLIEDPVDVVGEQRR